MAPEEILEEEASIVIVDLVITRFIRVFFQHVQLMDSEKFLIQL